MCSSPSVVPFSAVVIILRLKQLLADIYSNCYVRKIVIDKYQFVCLYTIKDEIRGLNELLRIRLTKIFLKLWHIMFNYGLEIIKILNY